MGISQTTAALPILLVPSLINPSAVLDLSPHQSLLEWLTGQGFDAMLLDWGVPTAADREQSIAQHVEQLLVPLLDKIAEPVHLVGYCLGGTMAMAAAMLRPVRSLTLIATPWHFDNYPDAARRQLADLWQRGGRAVDALGLLPMELLQTAFWGLDPDRTVQKYAALAKCRVDDPHVARFAALEDWANDGAPLTAAAGLDLFEHFVGANVTGNGQWLVGGRTMRPADLAVPARHFTAANDRIAPAATAPVGIETIPCPSGHVGMIAGSRAREGCWEPLVAWLRSVDQDQSRS